MCGIAGVISNQITETIKLKHNKMLGELQRRGPDSSGWVVSDDNRAILGHTRLSIIDPGTRASQPMIIPNWGLTIVFNGEIYNYEEIRKELQMLGVNFQTSSDTEVILWAWKEWGYESVNKLRGMFAFCIYDNINKRVSLVRDRFGIKPLYYSINGSNLIFSSTLTSICTYFGDIQLKTSSVVDFFLRGCTTQPNTIYELIYSVEPGTILIFNNENVTEIKKYWNLSEFTPKNENMDDIETIIQNSHSLVNEACKYSMVADVELGSFLSSGIDSSIITLLMAQLSSRNIKTFTVGYDDVDDDVSELEQAREIAAIIGTEHHEVIVSGKDVEQYFDDFIDSLDSPTVDGINTYLVSKYTSKFVKVALSGIGADEVFGGYDSFLNVNKYGNTNGRISKFLEFLFPEIKTDKLFRTMSSDHQFSFYRRVMNSSELKKALNRNYTEYINQNNHLSYVKGLNLKSDDSVTRYSQYEISGYLRNMLLRDSDAISMHFGLEIRPVFLDHKLLQYALSLPSGIKLRNNEPKYILKELARKFFPKHIVNKQKRGFSLPLHKWINSNLRERVYYILNSDIARFYFNEKYLKLLEKNISSGRFKNNIWLVVVFVSWIMRQGQKR